MKTAISNKGVEPTGGLTTYADAIRNIPYSIGSFDFSPIGYNSIENEEATGTVSDSILYSKSLYDEYNGVLSGSIRYLFNDDSKLKYYPIFDTSNATDMAGVFYMCSNLRIIPQLDTSNVTNMSNMFYWCINLQSVPLLDAGNVEDMNNMFYECYSLTYVGGLKNLGKRAYLTTTNAFVEANNISHDSIMNIINNLYDRVSAGYSTVTLPLGSTNLGRISDDEKAVATNKGWILV